jgi:hypothetical protein
MQGHVLARIQISIKRHISVSRWRYQYSKNPAYRAVVIFLFGRMVASFSERDFFSEHAVAVGLIMAAVEEAVAGSMDEVVAFGTGA